MLSAAEDWLRGSPKKPWREIFGLLSSVQPLSTALLLFAGEMDGMCGAIIACLPRLVLHLVSMSLVAVDRQSDHLTEGENL
jgi:hypothetical protein